MARSVIGCTNSPFISCECTPTCEEVNRIKEDLNGVKNELTMIKNEMIDMSTAITTINHTLKEMTTVHTAQLEAGDTGVLLKNTSTLKRIGQTVHLSGLLVYDLTATPLSDDITVADRIQLDEIIYWATVPEGFRPLGITVVAADQQCSGLLTDGRPLAHDCRFSSNLSVHGNGRLFQRDQYTYTFLGINRTIECKLIDRVTIDMNASWITEDSI